MQSTHQDRPRSDSRSNLSSLKAAGVMLLSILASCGEEVPNTRAEKDPVPVSGTASPGESSLPPDVSEVVTEEETAGLPEIPAAEGHTEPVETPDTPGTEAGGEAPTEERADPAPAESEGSSDPFVTPLSESMIGTEDLTLPQQAPVRSASIGSEQEIVEAVLPALRVLYVNAPARRWDHVRVEEAYKLAGRTIDASNRWEVGRALTARLGITQVRATEPVHLTPHTAIDSETLADMLRYAEASSAVYEGLCQTLGAQKIGEHELKNTITAMLSKLEYLSDEQAKAMSFTVYLEHKDYFERGTVYFGLYDRDGDVERIKARLETRLHGKTLISAEDFAEAALVAGKNCGIFEPTDKAVQPYRLSRLKRELGFGALQTVRGEYYARSGANLTDIQPDIDRLEAVKRALVTRLKDQCEDAPALDSELFQVALEHAGILLEEQEDARAIAVSALRQAVLEGVHVISIGVPVIMSGFGENPGNLWGMSGGALYAASAMAGGRDVPELRALPREHRLALLPAALRLDRVWKSLREELGTEVVEEKDFVRLLKEKLTAKEGVELPAFLLSPEVLQAEGIIVALGMDRRVFYCEQSGEERELPAQVKAFQEFAKSVRDFLVEQGIDRSTPVLSSQFDNIEEAMQTKFAEYLARGTNTAELIARSAKLYKEATEKRQVDIGRLFPEIPSKYTRCGMYFGNEVLLAHSLNHDSTELTGGVITDGTIAALKDVKEKVAEAEQAILAALGLEVYTKSGFQTLVARCFVEAGIECEGSATLNQELIESMLRYTPIIAERGDSGRLYYYLAETPLAGEAEKDLSEKRELRLSLRLKLSELVPGGAILGSQLRIAEERCLSGSLVEGQDKASIEQLLKDEWEKFKTAREADVVRIGRDSYSYVYSRIGELSSTEFFYVQAYLAGKTEQLADLTEEQRHVVEQVGKKFQRALSVVSDAVGSTATSFSEFNHLLSRALYAEGLSRDIGYVDPSFAQRLFDMTGLKSVDGLCEAYVVPKDGPMPESVRQNVELKDRILKEVQDFLADGGRSEKDFHRFIWDRWTAISAGKTEDKLELTELVAGIQRHFSYEVSRGIQARYIKLRDAEWSAEITADIEALDSATKELEKSLKAGASKDGIILYEDFERIVAKTVAALETSDAPGLAKHLERQGYEVVQVNDYRNEYNRDRSSTGFGGYYLGTINRAYRLLRQIDEGEELSDWQESVRPLALRVGTFRDAVIEQMKPRAGADEIRLSLQEVVFQTLEDQNLIEGGAFENWHLVDMLAELIADSLPTQKR